MPEEPAYDEEFGFKHDAGHHAPEETRKAQARMEPRLQPPPLPARP